MFPRFLCCGTRHDLRLIYSAYSFLEDTLSGVPIPVCFVLEPEAKPMECSMEPRRSFDEERCLTDLIFATEYVEEPLSVCLDPCRKIAGRGGIASTVDRQQRTVNISDH